MTKEKLAECLSVRFDEINSSLNIAGVSRAEDETAMLLGTEVASAIERLRKKEARRVSDEIGE